MLSEQRKAQQHAQSASSTTDALTSLAFTGNTGLLSSSALAALTSRLTHRASHGQLPSTEADFHGQHPHHHQPPYNPHPYTPFTLSVKEYDNAAFDPYAEEKKRKKDDKDKDKDKDKEKDKDDGTTTTTTTSWKRSSFTKKAKELGHRSSIAFLRVETMTTARKGSPVPPVPPLPEKYQHKQGSGGEGVVGRRPRPKSKTREGSQGASLRRWTLAMADVPDEVLVQELERLRVEGRGSRKKRKAHGHGGGERAGKAGEGESSSNGHADSVAAADEKALVYGGPDESKWREEWVKLRVEGQDESDSDTDGASHTEFGEHPQSPLSPGDEEDDAGWKSARRALLCCRELVRTERNYQSRLRQLLAGETDTPPPAIVLTYVPALLKASEALLARLEDDPSAWGVSVAFVGVEEDIEAAFVAWCGIVGEIFKDESELVNERPGRKAARSPKATSSLSPGDNSGLGKRSRSGVSISHLAQPQVESIYRKRTVSGLAEESAANTVNGSGMGLFTAALGTGLAFNIAPAPSSIPPQQSPDEFGHQATPSRSGAHIRSLSSGVQASGSGTLSLSKAFKRMSVFSSASSLPSTPTTPASAPVTMSSNSGKKAKTKEKEKRPTVRELAIQPTQRIMRYVLQYRGEYLGLYQSFYCANFSLSDLLQNTPTESPSRGLVERALESALKIAAKCDRAQGNSAFLRRNQ